MFVGQHRKLSKGERFEILMGVAEPELRMDGEGRWGSAEENRCVTTSDTALLSSGGERGERKKLKPDSSVPLFLVC